MCDWKSESSNSTSQSIDFLFVLLLPQSCHLQIGLGLRSRKYWSWIVLMVTGTHWVEGKPPVRQQERVWDEPGSRNRRDRDVIDSELRTVCSTWACRALSPKQPVWEVLRGSGDTNLLGPGWRFPVICHSLFWSIWRLQSSWLSVRLLQSPEDPVHLQDQAQTLWDHFYPSLKPIKMIQDWFKNTQKQHSYSQITKILILFGKFKNTRWLKKV